MTHFVLRMVPAGQYCGLDGSAVENTDTRLHFLGVSPEGKRFLIAVADRKMQPLGFEVGQVDDGTGEHCFALRPESLSDDQIPVALERLNHAVNRLVEGARVHFIQATIPVARICSAL